MNRQCIRDCASSAKKEQKIFSAKFSFDKEVTIIAAGSNIMVFMRERRVSIIEADVLTDTS